MYIKVEDKEKSGFLPKKGRKMIFIIFVSAYNFIICWVSFLLYIFFFLSCNFLFVC